MSPLELQQLVYIVLAPAGAIFLVLLLGRMGNDISDSRNRSFAILVATDIGWIVANWIEALWSTRIGTYVFMRVAYLFIAALPVAWLDYTIRLSGKARSKAIYRILLLSIIPAITQIMVYTNGSHHLMWQEIRYSSVLGLPFISTVAGPWFWIHATYSYVLTVAGALRVLDAYRDLSPSLKAQGRLTLAAVLVPLVYNLVFVTRIIPGFEKDFTSITFAVSATLFAFASERYGMFAAVPVARSALFDSLATAVFVINQRGLILDSNAAARALIGGRDPAGHFAEEYKPLELVSRSLWKKGSWEADIPIETAHGERPHELKCVPVTDPKGRILCRLVSLNDVTVRYELVRETSSIVKAAIDRERQASERSLPLCSSCGKARDTQGRWVPLTDALNERFGIQATHGLCPDCLPRYSGGGKRA